MPLILRLSIIQSMHVPLKQTNISYNKTDQKLLFDCIVCHSGSLCAFTYSMCNTGLHLSATHVPETWLHLLKNDYAYCLHRSLCAGLLHGSISSIALYQSVYSFLAVSALCSCLMHGSISSIAVHQSTFPVLRPLCTCLLHGSISSMAVHQSTFPLVLHALCTYLLHDLVSSMAEY